MIRVPRIPAPTALDPVKVAEWHSSLCAQRAQYYRELAAFRRGIGTQPKRPNALTSHYRSPAVHEALRLMFGPKCAYCEGDVAHVSPLHVEHYRPAARYPGLAYDWGNLLLACPHCNSTHKKDQFPIAPTGDTHHENHIHPCIRTGAEENPFLLNPCLDHPEDHLTFRNGRMIALTKRGHYTRRICGLNRDDLITARRQWLQIVLRYAYEYLNADMAGDLPRLDRYASYLRDLVTDTAQFAAMSRAELDRLEIPWRTL